MSAPANTTSPNTTSPDTISLYPDPVVNLESEPYWHAAKEGRLLLKRCASCGLTHYYPRALCPGCLSDQTQWFESKGHGAVYSFSVMRRAPVPYAIAYVRLDEGVTMMTQLVDCDFNTLAVDQRVQVQFRSTQGGYALPVFTPTQSPS